MSKNEIKEMIIELRSYNMPEKDIQAIIRTETRNEKQYPTKNDKETT